MRRRRGRGYTLWTSQGTGSYRSWSHAVGAARFAAQGSGAEVSMVNDATGESWDVSPGGRVSGHRA